MNNKEQKIENAAEEVAQITEINGGVDAEQIQAWKNRYGRIVEVCVADGEVGERHIGYFRRPDSQTMQAFSAVSKNNEMKGSEIVFDNCWLGGSPMMKSDAIYKINAMGMLTTMFSRCSNSLKNL